MVGGAAIYFGTVKLLPCMDPGILCSSGQVDCCLQYIYYMFYFYISIYISIYI
jgi:hypothetical protein